MSARVCPEAAQALARGELIEAIRLVRADTGLGLAEAKALVERFQQGETGLTGSSAPLPDHASAGAPGLPPDAEAALARGHVIEAIKIVRQKEGIGLKAAKMRVDAVRSTRRGQGQGKARAHMGAVSALPAPRSGAVPRAGCSCWS